MLRNSLGIALSVLILGNYCQQSDAQTSPTTQKPINNPAWAKLPAHNPKKGMDNAVTAEKKAEPYNGKITKLKSPGAAS